jgi:hypothetical protein
LMLYRHRRRFLGDQILHVRHVSYLFVYDIYERLHLNAIAAINVVQSRRISVWTIRRMLHKKKYAAEACILRLDLIQPQWKKKERKNGRMSSRQINCVRWTRNGAISCFSLNRSLRTCIHIFVFVFIGYIFAYCCAMLNSNADLMDFNIFSWKYVNHNIRI